jgi:uncharacterized membrane protein
VTVSLLLTLHLLSAALWVGGMATMHLAVRPAAVATLQPPQRLPFMAAALQRFLDAVATAIGVLVVSGFALIGLLGGLGAQRPSTHTMLALGLAMVAIYVYLRLVPFAALRRAVSATDWPAAAAALNQVRRLVLLNLVLGTVVFAVALIGRSL